MSDHQTESAVLMGAGRTTIYGDYVAPAVAAPRWHIESNVPGQTLCGQGVSAGASRMHLHVSLLECGRCMALGEHVFPPASTPPDPS